MPPPQAERFVLTPSILIDEAYTDNVFLDNDFKRSDFITSFTPGLLLGFRTHDFGSRPGLRLHVGDLRQGNPTERRSRALGRQRGDLLHLTPQLRIDLDAAYFEDNNTTASGIAGVSTGRTRSRGATVSPALTWQFDPVTQSSSGLPGTRRASTRTSSPNVPLSTYDTYTFSPTISRRITPTLTGTFQYQYLFPTSTMARTSSIT